MFHSLLCISLSWTFIRLKKITNGFSVVFFYWIIKYWFGTVLKILTYNKSFKLSIKQGAIVLHLKITIPWMQTAGNPE